MSKILPAVFLVFVLVFCSFMELPRTMANPLPDDVNWKGMGGGAPYSKNDPIPVYLRNETVRAVIEDKIAHMTCVYLLRNDGNVDAEVDIVLPFVREPKGLKMYLDGEKLPFLERTYEYHPIYFDDNWNLSNILDGLSSASFQLHIEAGAEIEVRAEYDTDINTYKGVDGSVSYHYSYLVGSGRFWDHPIESARFEVRVPSRFYTEYDFSDDWDIRRTLTRVVFEKEYNDWVPERDLEVLRWEETKRTPIDTLVIVLMSIGLAFLLLAIVSSVVYVIWRRVRADRLEEE